MLKKFVVPLSGGLLLGLFLTHVMSPNVVHSQEAGKQNAKTTPGQKEVTDLDHLRASAAEFEKAFNSGNAKALAALFAEKAEVVDENGDLVEGRANIETRFADSFKNFPKARIAVEITSLRQLSPDVAVEDGVSTVTLDPEAPPSRSPYSLVHVKRDGKWLFASVRDYPEEPSDTPHNHLTQLEFLVGQWIDESQTGRVETVCNWSDDGNYLMQEYVVKTRRGVALRGTQRIGWDPLRRTIRAWVFDHAGGIVESTWTPVEGSWFITAAGTTPDGKAVSANRVVTPLSNDSFQIESTHQFVGGELLPDSSVKVVRRPPAPSK